LELERDIDITWASVSNLEVTNHWKNACRRRHTRQGQHVNIDSEHVRLFSLEEEFSLDVISPPVFFAIALPNVSMKWKLKFI